MSGRKTKQKKIRPICYPAHIDGHIYSYYAKNISLKYEKKLILNKLDKNVLAFRKIDGKNNIDFAKQAFDDIKDIGECSVLALDFSDFFNSLDHNKLKKQWCKILETKTLPNDHYNIYKSLTKYTIVDRDSIYKLFNISKNN